MAIESSDVMGVDMFWNDLRISLLNLVLKSKRKEFMKARKKCYQGQPLEGFLR